MIASGVPLVVFGVGSWFAWLVLWPTFYFSWFFLYCIAGHAFLYGPHLFVFGFVDIIKALVRLKRK